MDWDTSINAVVIKTNEDLLNKIKILNGKISYAYDERLFTLFAFMNYTGYNDENNSYGMHLVRVDVREELKDMNLKLSDNNYYDNKDMSSSRYYDGICT